jgi:hypothetical protein
MFINTQKKIVLIQLITGETVTSTDSFRELTQHYVVLKK